ncbi:hypothetical protein SAMN04487886_106614 [Clostridium sp. DSM 8431]|uniref:hypothetical protein n=1 Tax=Clostridium sp. DSM 8431 TaxID=1761781 RepID=UPI0008F0E082|nr:hypothetical protein [Clostridium sp. DSM 8431]SFU58659.1 hypothetical protein SAMN04487886_106614 [Clostridium sp. DSM 8431]
MIETLKRKFVVTAMTAVTVLIVLMLGAINVVNVVSIRNSIDNTLQIITENAVNPKIIHDKVNALPPSMSTFRPKDDHDKMLASNFFVVHFDNAGNIVFTDTSHIATVSDSSAKEIAKNVYSSGKTTGKIGKFRFLIEDSKDVKGKTAVFLDSSSEIMSYIRVLLLSGGIDIICWCGMLFLVIILSRKAISPIAENIERQKQFVTNAGHEIKTPLAIIQANADAMELYNGERI